MFRLISLFMIVATFLSAAEKGDFKIGFGLGGNLNLHSPNFANSSTFPVNEAQSSLGFYTNILLNYKISKMFEFSGRIGHHSLNTEFNSGTIGTAPVSLSYLEFTPTVQVYDLIPVDNLYFLGGLEFGIPLTQTFKNEDIPEVNSRIALALGLGYDYAVSNKFAVSPELSFRIPFSQVSANSGYTSWDVPQIRLGVNLTFNLSNNDKPIEEAKADNSIQVDFKQIRTFDKNGNPQPVERIKVEELQYVELFPILPYLFFDEKSDKPNKNLIEMTADNQTGKFNLEALEPNSLQINKSILDIIGARMQKYPNATLALTGTNDNTTEKGMNDISTGRAEFVKNYLVVSYSIDPTRITVVAQGLPSKPSAQKDKDGIAENRRVEISSNIKEILQPIVIEKEKQAIADPNYIEFETDVQSADSNLTWEFEITQTDRQVKTITGTGKPDVIKWNILPNDVAQGEIPIYYNLAVKNSKGGSNKKSGTLKTEFISISKKKTEDLPDKTISKFSLVVFDFDSPNISEQDKEVVDKFIIPAIKFNSIVQVFGYTDRIGDDKYNSKLALARAESVKQYIASKTKANKFEVFGLGERIQLFDNNSPIGRNLSRTVQVEIITPKTN